MMNQAVNTQSMAPASDPKSLEGRYVVDASQGQTTSYLPSAAGAENGSWNLHSAENGVLSSSMHQLGQQTEPQTKTVQDGMNVASHVSSSTTGTTNAPQDYSSYASYSSSDPYSAYGSSGYQGYYSSYQQQPGHSYSQQQATHSYSQPSGAYQNTGAPYQPLSSFQNTGSYAGTASYSTTYYNPGDYQTAGGYPSSGYSNQTGGYTSNQTTWNDGNYANYASHQYSSYAPDTTSAYTSSVAASTPVNYQQHQHYKQWADYYSQNEVTCAPGTEHLAPGTSNQGSVAPGVTSAYPTSSSQPPPTYAPTWRPESTPSGLPSSQPAAGTAGAHDNYWKQGTASFHSHHASSMQSHFQKPLDSKTSDNFQGQVAPQPQAPNSQYPIASQGPNAQYHTAPPPAPIPYHSAPPQAPTSQYASAPQVGQSYQLPAQNSPALDTRRVGKVQIPTNPRIASNLGFGLPKNDKDGSALGASAKPAFISVSLPKANEKSNDAADALLKPGVFPNSLRGYVERAFQRCKDDPQKMIGSQAVMKEIITKATADGTLYTRDWDAEPLFPLPNHDNVNKENSQNSTPILTKIKKSPSRRSKSRWEPLPAETPVEKPVSTSISASINSLKPGGWDRNTMSGNSLSKEDPLGNIKFSLSEQNVPSKNSNRPIKRQRLVDAFNAADNGDASSDSDKEQGLTAYYSGAMAFSNSPEEKKRRENRSKRFEKVQGHRPETNHSKPRHTGPGNLYSRRASALILSKSFDNGGNRAVEDMDWDALTVKGTCQEIEKRYLRLTSAPDPSTVRPEEVLEKALVMVQNTPKNYLYKCDQLKSIRQDLTVQRIRNHLTAKVYETHARFALEAGDLPEFNQCQSQLKTLYAEGIEGCHMEFAAYNLLCTILHSNNNRDLLSSMSRLTDGAKKDKTVKHALAVRAAVTSGNYVMFFKLYKTAPDLIPCLMDLYVEKIRYKAVNCMCRSYRPTVPVPYIAQVLGFSGASGGNEKDLDGSEECVEWLKAHGACLITDNNGEMQLDTKASSSTLYMPEPEDAVAHGDANLAVNDFFTRTSL